ncbi:unnamed protein product [Rhizophagus irregularis]|nr:unnamed protein product [Rhizophagus irregularis]
MDYSSMLKHLAKEAGIVVPPNSFSKSGSPSLNKNEKSNKLKLDKWQRRTRPFEAQGGFGKVYSAKSSAWGKVALKFLDNSESLASDFLDELRAHHRCSLGSGIIDCYGVSKDPETNRYVMRLSQREHIAARKARLCHRFRNVSTTNDICNGLRPPIISGTPKGYVAAMLRCWDADPSKRPTAADLLNVSAKWRYLSDGKAPFQGPRTKKIKTGSVKSVITNSGAVHPQAFYTSRLLHFPHLPEPRNSETFTLFDPTTGELLTMIRKSSSKRDPAGSATNDNKGKEKAREDYQTHNGRREVTRSMTLGKVDKEMIDKLKADRRQHSHYRWSSIINEVPREVELYRVDEKEKQS